MSKVINIIPHNELFENLLSNIQTVDFSAKAGLPPNELRQAHYLVISIEEIIAYCKTCNFNLAQKNGFIYLYNGAFWKKVTDDEMKLFLSKASEKLGVDKFTASIYTFQDALYKQFKAVARIPDAIYKDEKVLINLKNGTLEISQNGVNFRGFQSDDFLTYQLPFDYDKSATCSMFCKFFDEVLPEKESQMVLFEFLGYVFMPHQTLKLEKVPLLYGTGANGKSTVYEIINALLGEENITSIPLQNLTNSNGYSRCALENKLLNYASEITGQFEAAIFKQLASGEPIEARLPYHKPFTLKRYAKLMFNCNELPSSPEFTDAFFRRFLIIPFKVSIPEDKQDRELAKRIIAAELSGVFNLVMEGLNRLLQQKNFTYSESIANELNIFRQERDTIKMFLDEYQYKPHTSHTLLMKDLYADYRIYCNESGFIPRKRTQFTKDMQKLQFVLDRDKRGNYCYIAKAA